jgi:Fur family peroxide stress response transcriptional regulator
MNKGMFKHSKKRDAILEVLKATKSHPTAAWVYEQLKDAIPDLSLGTVYRNISVLRDQGFVRSVGVVAGEEHFDGFAEPHPHIVCTVCGSVQDVPQQYAAQLQLFMEGGNFTAFGVDPRRTVLYGQCSDCSGH